MHYSIEPEDRIFVKGHGLLSFAKNMGKNIGKNFSNKYSQKRFHCTEINFATYALQTASKRAIQKTAEATCQQVIKLQIKLQGLSHKALQANQKHLRKQNV